MDRLRTTLTYVYVMTKGTQQERDAVAGMVNKMHAPVRGEGYTAYDRDLQPWVAATLAHNGIFIQEKVFGPMSPESKEQIYRDSQVFGTALQVRAEDWPATYADFERYWDHTLTAQLRSEPRTDLVVARAEALRPVLERAQLRLPHAAAFPPVRARAARAARLPSPAAPGQARHLGSPQQMP